MPANKEQFQAFGQPLAKWEVLEHRKHERTLMWYVIAGIIAALLLVYSVITANYMFALILMMIGFITFIISFREPDHVDVYITTNGIALGEHYYEYKEIKDFSIAYEPPEIKLLYIDFHKRLHPMMSIPLEDVDPNNVREVLLPYVIENLERDEESLIDMMSRLYKI